MKGSPPDGPRQPPAAPSAVRLDSAVAAPEAAFAVDRSGRVVYWNRACERLSGIAAAEAIGRLCGDVLRARSAAGTLCAETCVLASRGHGAACGEGHADVELTTSTGVRQLAVQTVQLSVRSEALLVHLLRDITAQQRVVVAARRVALAVDGLHPAPEKALDKPLITTREREALAGLAESCPPTRSRPGWGSAPRQSRITSRTRWPNWAPTPGSRRWPRLAASPSSNDCYRPEASSTAGIQSRSLERIWWRASVRR